MADDDSPAPESAPPDPGERIRQLEADLNRERGHREALEGTFRALAPQQPQQPVEQGIVRFPRESAQRIARTLGGGWNEDAVQAHAPVFAAFVQELAGPLLSGLEGMADVVDLLQARQEVPEYETQAQEADRVRQEYRAQGRVITRKEAVALVKSRRMQDPAYVDRLIEQRAQARASAEGERAAHRAGAVTEGGPSAQAAGPAPTKAVRRPQTKEEFARLSLEDKRKALADAVI
jgi:hypothetical protein